MSASSSSTSKPSSPPTNQSQSRTKGAKPGTSSPTMINGRQPNSYSSKMQTRIKNIENSEPHDGILSIDKGQYNAYTGTEMQEIVSQNDPTNGVAVQMREKLTRKISNIEHTNSQGGGIQLPKRSNSYASKPSHPIKKNSSSPTSFENTLVSSNPAVGVTENGDQETLHIPGRKISKVKEKGDTVSKEQFASHLLTVPSHNNNDSETAYKEKNNASSPITRQPSSFHGVKMSDTVSALTNQNISTRERRASCYAGTMNEVSTSDLFSNHRDDSGFPRLHWKEENVSSDVIDEGKRLKIFTNRYFSFFSQSFYFCNLVKIDQYGTKENAIVLICFQMILNYVFH